MIECRILGPNVDALDPHEAHTKLAAIPRRGETLSVWDGRDELYVEIYDVVYPTWSYEHLGDDDQKEPTILLRRADSMSDAEWADVFAAINERRHP